MIERHELEIAAHERPEEQKQPFTRLVVAVLVIMAFILGALIGHFGV